MRSWWNLPRYLPLNFSLPVPYVDCLEYGASDAACLLRLWIQTTSVRFQQKNQEVSSCKKDWNLFTFLSSCVLANPGLQPLLVDNKVDIWNPSGCHANCHVGNSRITPNYPNFSWLQGSPISGAIEDIFLDGLLANETAKLVNITPASRFMTPKKRGIHGVNLHQLVRYIYIYLP